MPLVNVSIQKQEQAGASSTRTHPLSGAIANNWFFSDQFNRTTLNPSDVLALYATTVAGTGTIVIAGANSLQIQTGTTINSNTQIRLSEMAFQRQALGLENRGTVIYESTFQNNATVAGVEMFVGLVIQSSANLTALPTSAARHLGIQLDASVSGNFFWTTANGTDEVNTDTGILANTARRRLRISWTGDDSAIMEVFDGTLLDNLVDSITVTDIDMSDTRVFTPVWFMENEAAANKDLRIQWWAVSWLP